MAKELLLEIGCEEIPAGMVPPALDYLKERLAASLAEQHLAPRKITGYATPRRLVVCAAGVPERQSDRTEEVLGPPASAALDSAGAYTRAALGFAAKHGAEASQLAVVQTPKGSYVAVRKSVPGRPAEVVLAETLPTLIKAIPFPKTLTWEAENFRFVRPLRNLLVLLDGVVIPLELAGVRAGTTTFGHRFLGAGKIPIKRFAGYIKKLERNGVLIDPQRRRAKIEAEIDAIISARGFTLVPDPELLEQVTYLNEYPTVITGDFEPRFLALPREVLVTVLRKHQKYFSLTDSTGKIVPHFLAVINMDGDPEGLIRAGHERVLKARLTDAEFFWNVDRKATLASRVPALSNVLFQETLGSYLEKIERLQITAPYFAAGLGCPADLQQRVAAAARLSKVDLTTEMVKELTELQGIMGGLYTREEGLPEGVWQAIYEHYRPEGTDDAIPRTMEGAILAITDKADTVVGMLGLGFVPTGSRDPFGLRRLASGIYRIVLEKELDVDLAPLFAKVREVLADKLTVPLETLLASLAEFLEGRVRFHFGSAGYRYDEINAVIARAVFQPVDAARRLAALLHIRDVPAFTAIFIARKRIANIIAKQGAAPSGPPRPDLFQEDEERKLHDLLQELAAPVRSAIHDGRYPDVLDLIERFADPLEIFFQKVLVMHEDPALRENRLRLLTAIGGLFDEFCDFSRFVLDEKAF